MMIEEELRILRPRCVHALQHLRKDMPNEEYFDDRKRT